MTIASRFEETKCGDGVNKKTDSISYTDSETVSSSGELNGLSRNVYFNENDIIEFHEDLTIKAGTRLYHQAVDQLSRLKQRREEELSVVKASLDLPTKTPIGQKVRSVVSKKNQEQLKNWTPRKKAEPMREKKLPDIEVLKSAPVPERCNRLYLLSSDEQLLGKQRRALIEEKKAKIRAIPESKILPASRSGDMYLRGMERLVAQKMKLAEKAEEARETRS
mmetsp:Transcript_3769/g.4621  ORF Transcript_3769/g.4621 Transcript_3769/m.4621 type:complete len:221 (+) Transcript_3769:105-767(+)